MREIHSYVIRIYRHDADTVVGVVEDVERQKTMPFQSLAELTELLGGRKPFTPKPKTPKESES